MLNPMSIIAMYNIISYAINPHLGTSTSFLNEADPVLDTLQRLFQLLCQNFLHQPIDGLPPLSQLNTILPFQLFPHPLLRQLVQLCIRTYLPYRSLQLTICYRLRAEVIDCGSGERV